MIRRLALLGTLAAAVSFTPVSHAQTCTGVPYYEACLDAVGGAPADGSAPRDPTRIIDDIFRTTDTPPLFAPQLTFGQLVVPRSVFNSPACTGGVSSGEPGTDPRQYAAYVCHAGVTGTDAPTYTNALDWRWVQNNRMRTDGTQSVDLDGCGGDLHLCGFETPWLSGFVFDLQGSANRVVVFPITDHVANSCLEAFEYSVFLTDNPASTEFVTAGMAPDPTKWNRAVLTRAFLRGWTLNYQSTGTAADMAVHPLTDAAGGEAIADSIATVWSLPCGITFRYASIVAGNSGNPDDRCAFFSAEDEFDAVAGLNEDGSAICRDVDGDGFRDAACGGSDCNDSDPAIHPGAAEDCRTTVDQNCDGMVPMCPTGTACVNGVCAAACLEGACADGFNCVSTSTGGACVPAGCAGVTCPAGQICGPVGCQAPCDGALCPLGQTCIGGACVDLCAGIVCSMNQHCDGGRCVPNCSCTGCASPLVCNATSGVCEQSGCSALPCPPEQRDCRTSTPRCVTSFCDGIRCPLGQTCSETAHACIVDRCFGIACAPPLTCSDGACVLPASDGGTDGGSNADAGDGGTNIDASNGDGAMNGDARADGSQDAGRVINNPGCGCRTTGAPRSGLSMLALCAAIALCSANRRRRRR